MMPANPDRARANVAADGMEMELKKKPTRVRFFNCWDQGTRTICNRRPPPNDKLSKWRRCVLKLDATADYFLPIPLGSSVRERKSLSPARAR
jgi:hypothetical protein